MGALAAVASAGKGIYDSTKKPNTIDTPGAAAAPVPAGPAADLTASGIAGQKPSSLNEPGFLRFSPGMTSLQKRAQIATYGTQSGDSRFSDPATKDYYKNLLLSEYDPAKGLPGGVLPIEKQFASNVFGVQPRADSTESFLSALLRG
jgi:hypothetical protein